MNNLRIFFCQSTLNKSINNNSRNIDTINAIDSYLKKSKGQENYESVSTMGHIVPEIEINVTRKPYPSTRNKSMPKFCSEETLFCASKYETNKVVSPTLKRDKNPNLAIDFKNELSVFGRFLNGKCTCNYSQQRCGIYCKNIKSEDEKEMIFKIQDYEIATPSRSGFQKNEEEYIVPIKWWRKWCDYVNIEAKNYSELAKIFSKTHNYISDSEEVKKLTEQESNGTGIERNCSSSTNINSPFEKQEAEERYYDRPGKIINEHLINEKAIVFVLPFHKQKLKENLQDGYDYIRIDSFAWNLLKIWYGYDYEVIYTEESNCVSSFEYSEAS